VENEEDIAAFNNWVEGGADAVPAAVAAEPEQAAAATPSTGASAAPVQRASGERIFVSPLAKIMANEAGIGLDGIQGTGPNNRIIKADVEEAIAAAKSAPAKKVAEVEKPAAAEKVVAKAPEPSALYDDLTNSNIRKVVAERLTYSKQNIPHYYVTYSVNVD